MNEPSFDHLLNEATCEIVEHLERETGVPFTDNALRLVKLRIAQLANDLLEEEAN